MTQTEFNVAVVDAYANRQGLSTLFSTSWENISSTLRQYAVRSELSTTIFSTLTTH